MAGGAGCGDRLTCASGAALSNMSALRSGAPSVSICPPDACSTAARSRCAEGINHLYRICMVRDISWGRRPMSETVPTPSGALRRKAYTSTRSKSCSCSRHSFTSTSAPRRLE